MEIIKLPTNLFSLLFISILLVSPAHSEVDISSSKSWPYDGLFLLSHKIKLTANQFVEMSNTNENGLEEADDIRNEEEIFLGCEYSDSYTIQNFMYKYT